jgi:hypothetical protein
LVLALALLVSGCLGDDEKSGSPAKTGPAKACEHCIADDFSKAKRGWPDTDSEGREISRAGGEYAVTLTEAGTFTFMGPDVFDAEDQRVRFPDSTVSVTARAATGTPAMGVLCRWNDAGGEDARAYTFNVLEDRYGVRGPAGQTLKGGGLPEGTDLTEPTKLEATCKGETLTFSVNGTRVATVNDSNLKAGSDGLLVATNPDATVPATAVYDDYEQR